MTDSDLAHENDLTLELYKALRQEASLYIKKVPAIWLQKLFLIGTMAGFALALPTDLLSDLDQSVEQIICGILIVIAVLSVLLDLKTLEYALHSRMISRFISERYESHAIVAEWEKVLWGQGKRYGGLAAIRSWTTFAVTICPTAMLLILTPWFGVILTEGRSSFIWLGVGVGITYLVGAGFFAKKKLFGP